MQLVVSQVEAVDLVQRGRQCAGEPIRIEGKIGWCRAHEATLCRVHGGNCANELIQAQIKVVEKFGIKRLHWNSARKAIVAHFKFRQAPHTRHGALQAIAVQEQVRERREFRQQSQRCRAIHLWRRTDDIDFLYVAVRTLQMVAGCRRTILHRFETRTFLGIRTVHSIVKRYQRRVLRQLERRGVDNSDDEKNKRECNHRWGKKSVRGCYAIAAKSAAENTLIFK